MPFMDVHAFLIFENNFGWASAVLPWAYDVGFYSEVLLNGAPRREVGQAIDRVRDCCPKVALGVLVAITVREGQLILSRSNT
jgi:hypothetical protein